MRTYRINPAPLDEAMDWLAQRRRVWEQRLDRLDDYLLTMKETE